MKDYVSFKIVVKEDCFTEVIDIIGDYNLNNGIYEFKNFSVKHRFNEDFDYFSKKKMTAERLISYILNLRDNKNNVKILDYNWEKNLLNIR